MLKVIDPGILTTIQDAGRWGYQKYGVPVSGAMDLAAMRAANRLVRNPTDEATLELRSPVALQTDSPCLFALTGADARVKCDGREMPMWMSIFMRAGTLLEVTPRLSGGWIYLAVHGGFDIPIVLGSKSTYLRGAFGGLEGKALEQGDQIPIGMQTIGDLVAHAGKSVESHMAKSEIEIVLGPHDEWFAPEAIASLTSGEFILSELADRMGYRLKSPTRLSIKEEKRQANAGELVSCGVPLGAIQVPPDGQPIVLMADHQTTGGYPIIATVTTEGIGAVAQHIPGDHLRFRIASAQTIPEMV